MPRLRNIWTNVVVSVSDRIAERLGRDWRPVDEATEKAPVRRRSPRKIDEE
jgi:hypothetical protein